MAMWGVTGQAHVLNCKCTIVDLSRRLRVARGLTAELPVPAWLSLEGLGPWRYQMDQTGGDTAGVSLHA